MSNDTLKQLKEKVRPLTLLDILAVIEGVKPGVAYISINTIKKELKELGFYFTKMYGGYITKDIHLYKKWKKWFAFNKNHELFLGYPKCCVENHNYTIQNLYILELYKLIKQVRNKEVTVLYFKKILDNSLIIPHRACSFYCEETWKLNKQYKTVLAKYNWLTHGINKELIKRKIEILIHNLEDLSNFIKHVKVNNSYIKAHNINYEDIQELKTAKGKQNIKFGIKLLKNLY